MTFRLVGATTCAVLLAGCGSSGYFMVREPGSVTPYYTTSISTDGSALKFKDAKTGSAVTLQSSEVRKISKDEFTTGMTPAPAAVIVPVPATVGAQTPAGAGASAPAAVPIPAEAPPAKPQ